MATTVLPTDQDTKDYPATTKVFRQIDCSYTFGDEALTLNLKFLGDASEVVSLTSTFRKGYRVKISDLKEKFDELGSLAITSLETSGKVTTSTATTKQGGTAQAVISINIPYKDKMSGGSSGGEDEPEARKVVTWSERSTDYGFPLEIYAGEGTSASEINAGNLEAWKQMKAKDIALYKEFKFKLEGEDEPTTLEGHTLEIAKKIYSGIESVRRAYPEVVRTTQYFNYRGDTNTVDATLISKIDEDPNLYYRDQTPNAIWADKFPDFDWLKASFDVQTEATEYDKMWNMTVTESWIGCDTNEKGTWDDQLYGADGTRWTFATADSSQADPQNPVTPVQEEGPTP